MRHFMLLAASLACLTACADPAPNAVKPEPYTYVSPPEPRGDKSDQAGSTYVPATRDPTATPYPQF